MNDFLTATSESKALTGGFDVFHEKIGNDVLDIFANYAPAQNELSELLSINEKFLEDIVGESMLAMNGAPKFPVNIEQKKQGLADELSTLEAALKSTEFIDNMGPAVSKSGQIVAPRGVDPTTYDWEKYYTIVDNLDGPMSFADATVDTSAIDFSTVGKYSDGIVVSIPDSYGNIGERKSSVIIYNPDNTTPPVVEVKADYRKIAKDEDTGSIKWGDDFIASATDADGFDVKANTTADVSNLDVTAAGTYDVVITVTDYAGNTTDVTVPVTVE